MLFLVQLVVPVSGCANFLGFCPVLHAVFFTITQRHWKGGRKHVQVVKLHEPLLNLVRRVWIR
jgi:hypothetical protein